MDGQEAQKRVMTALNHEQPDRVPICDGFWPEFIEKWRREKQLGRDADICKYYGLDVRRQGGLSADQSPRPSGKQVLEEKGDFVVYRDGWGRIMRARRSTAFEHELELPLKKKSDFDAYRFESPCIASRYEGLSDSVEQEKKDFCVFFKTGGPYSRTVKFRGTQQFLIDMAEDPVFVKTMVDRMTQHLVATMNEGLKRGQLPPTAVWIADDIAYKNSLLFSPATYEKIFYHGLKQICTAIKKTGRKVIYESEGNVAEVLDLLIDAGVEIFACLEPRAGMDISRLRKKYGSRIAFIGNVCNVIVLPGSSKNAIKREVFRVLAAAEDGGYIGGSAHSVGPDIPVENYDYMIELFRQYGRYPLHVKG